MSGSRKAARIVWSDNPNANMRTQAEDVYAVAVKLDRSTLVAHESDDRVPTWVGNGA